MRGKGRSTSEADHDEGIASFGEQCPCDMDVSGPSHLSPQNHSFHDVEQVFLVTFVLRSSEKARGGLQGNASRATLCTMAHCVILLQGSRILLWHAL